MFRKFFEFVGESTKQDIRSVDEFLEYCSGKSFLNGLYRIHNTADIPKWNDIAGRAFPEFAGIIKVFGYDWLGRHFAVDSRDNTILLLEPGTGEVLGIPADFVDFHNTEIAEFTDDCLAAGCFSEWYEASGHYELLHSQCAGYKVPLFLNGQDTLDNLEVSDMEVYWEIMAPLINL